MTIIIEDPTAFMTPRLCRMGRAALGLSRPEMQAQIDAMTGGEGGIHSNTLLAYENGQRGISAGKAQLINRLFAENGYEVVFINDRCGLTYVWDFLDAEGVEASPA